MNPNQNPRTSLLMKTPSFLRRVSVVVAAVGVFALSSPAHAQSWTGGNSSGSTSWGATSQWSSVPTFTNTTDLTFNVLTAPNTWIGANRTIRSLTYGVDIDSALGVNLQDFNFGTARNLTFDTDAVGGNATITVASGATGNITIGNATSTGGTLGGLILADNLVIDHNGSGLLNLNRQISGTNFGITKSGTGTLRIGTFNANSFTGAANFNQGTTILNNTGAVGGDLNTASAINLGGGTLRIQTSSALNKTLTSNMTVSAASTLAYENTTNTTQTLAVSTGTMALDANLTVQNISSNTTLANGINISRNIAGTGAMIVETYNNITSEASDYGLGRVALSGNNTGWSGGAVIRQGTAALSGNSTLGSGVNVNAGTGSITLGETSNSFGAGLQLAASAGGGAQIINNNIIVRSGGFRSIRSFSDHTYSLNGTIALEGSLTVVNSGFFTDKHIILNGNISGVGGLNIAETGNPGFTRLTGNNTYSGATSIGTGAVLNILSSSGNAIGDSSAVTFAGAGATLVFNSTNESVGSIASSGTDGAINLGANTITTGGNNASTSFGGVISGTGGSLTKVGSGTMTLTAAQGYTGSTTVSTGTLVLGVGATLASTNIQVDSGATLDASALVGGLSIASASRIGGDGTITGDLSLVSGAQFVFSLTQTLDVTGTLTLDNAFSVASLVNANGSAVDWSVVSNGTYTLIGATGDFSNITNFGLANKATGLGGGKEAYFQNGSLQLVVIPEPSTWALLALGMTTMVVFRRRRSA